MSRKSYYAGASNRLIGMHNIAGDNDLIALLSGEDQCEGIVQKIVLPGAHISRVTGAPTGLVYVVDGDAPAAALLGHKLDDLCAGISLYSFFSVPEGFVGKARQVISTLNTRFLDLSIFENRQTTLHRHVPADARNCLTLGKENCSVSITKTVDENLNHCYHLVVRNYCSHSTYKLRQLLAEQPEITVSQFVENPLYKQAIRNGDLLRGAIAKHITHVLGCTATSAEYSDTFHNDQSLLFLTPVVEHHYNVFARHNGLGPSIVGGNVQRYSFYDGCCNLNEASTPGVLFGLGRGLGFQFYATTLGRSLRCGFSDYANAFPIGVPMKRGATGKVNEPSVSLYEKVKWSGAFDINHKAFSNAPDTDYITKQENRSFLHQLIGLRPEDVEPRRMLTEACYISSPIEERLSIPHLLTIRSKRDPTLRILVYSTFVEKEFMPLFLKYKRTAERIMCGGPGESRPVCLSDVIVKEDDHFMYFNPEHLAALLSCR